MICIGCGDEEPKGIKGIRFKHIAYTLCGRCFDENYYPALANKTRTCTSCGESLVAESTICRVCRDEDPNWHERVAKLIRVYIRSQQKTTFEMCVTCDKLQKHATIKTRPHVVICVECGSKKP